MSDCKVSIVVPVYNAEKFLHRCVDSILAQTYKDFELILVNDGSKDNSQAICEEYAREDNRITVIKKENGGVSSCRQLGLELMKGKFLQFIDSDDYIEKNCLEENLRIAETTNADIVISDFFVDGKDVQQRWRRQEYRGDLIDDFFSGRIFGALWNKLIRIELIRRSGVSFCHGLNFCEDLTFLCELTISTRNMRIEMNPTAYYHYCANANSLTAKVTKSKLENEEKYIDVMTNVLQQRGKNIYFQSNYLSIAWGYLKLGCIPFNEYKRKLSKVSLCGNNVSLSKKLVLTFSGYSIGYAIIKRLFRKRHR